MLELRGVWPPNRYGSLPPPLMSPNSLSLTIFQGSHYLFCNTSTAYNVSCDVIYALSIGTEQAAPELAASVFNEIILTLHTIENNDIRAWNSAEKIKY